MIRTVDPQQRPQFAVGNRWIREVNGVGPAEGVVPLEGRDIAVSTAVDQKVVVRYDGGSGEGRVLAVGRCDGRDGAQVEAIRSKAGRAVERDQRMGEIGLDRRQSIEERRMSDTLAAARMAHNHDAVQVDLAAQRMARFRIPDAKLLEMFQMDDGSAVVLAEVPAIEEIHVDGRGDDPVRREQVAQVQVARCRVRRRSVIAVRKHGQRERTTATRDANVPVERHIGIVERPRRGETQLSEGRDVDPSGHIRRVRSIVDGKLIQGGHCRVIQPGRCVDYRVEREVARQGGIGNWGHHRSSRHTVPPRVTCPLSTVVASIPRRQFDTGIIPEILRDSMT